VRRVLREAAIGDSSSLGVSAMIVTWGKSTDQVGCVREEIKGRASGRRGGFLIGVRCSSLGHHSSSVEHDTSQSEVLWGECVWGVHHIAQQGLDRVAGH
jgi:hypothetical protein